METNICTQQVAHCFQPLLPDSLVSHVQMMHCKRWKAGRSLGTRLTSTWCPVTQPHLTKFTEFPYISTLSGKSWWI